jgi:hypothetical protein
MRTNVHVPIRARIGADALGSGELERAVGDALHRVVKRADDVLGGSAGNTTVHPPSFAWKGAGLVSVSAEDRAAAESRLRAVVTASSAGFLKERPQERRQDRWAVVARAGFRIRLGTLADLYEWAEGDASEIRDLYAAMIDEPVAATAHVIEARRPVRLVDAATALAERVELELPTDQLLYWLYSSEPLLRQRLVFATLDQDLANALPSMDVNLGRVYGYYQSAVLLGGARAILVTFVLPKVKPGQLVERESEEFVGVTIRELATFVEPLSFERLFGVSWLRYVAECADKRENLFLLPVRPPQPVDPRTVRRAVEEMLLKETPSTAALFGRLRLLNESGIADLPAPAREQALEMSDQATLALPAEAGDGEWRAGWRGVYAYVQLAPEHTGLAAARYQGEAREAADAFALAVAKTDRISRRIALRQFLHRYDIPAPRPEAFQFLLAELERRDALDAFFAAFEFFNYEKPLLDLAWKTSFKDHPRVRQAAEHWAAFLAPHRLHRYFPERNAMWVDGDPKQELKVGEVIADKAYDAYQTIYDERLRPDRKEELDKAMEEASQAIVGGLLRDEDAKAYSDPAALYAAIAKKAADDIALGPNDVEKYVVGLRSARLEKVELGPPGPERNHLITYHLVEQPAGTHDWNVVRGSERTVNEWEWQALIWGWRYEHWADFLTTVAKWEMAIIGLALAPIVFPEMLVIAGGAKAVLVGVVVSEAFMIGTHLYKGEEITVEDFVVAAIEGYVFALGFHGAGTLGKAIFGDAAKITSATLRANLLRWAGAQIFKGTLGGSSTAVANRFVKDLIEVELLGTRGRFHTAGQYAQEAAFGAAVGAAFELAGPILTPAMRRVGSAFGTGLEAGAAAFRTLRGVARWLRISGVDEEAMEKLAETAEEAMEKELKKLLKTEAAKDVAKSFGDRLRAVRDAIKGLPGEMAGVIAEDLLELAGVELNATARRGLEKLLRPDSPFSADAVHTIAKGLAREPGKLGVFLEAAGGLERASLQEMGTAGLEALARSPRVQAVARSYNGAARFEMLRKAAKSLDDAERYLADLETAPFETRAAFYDALERGDADALTRLLEGRPPEPPKPLPPGEPRRAYWARAATLQPGREAIKAARERVAELGGEPVLQRLDAAGADTANGLLMGLGAVQGGIQRAHVAAIRAFLERGGNPRILADVLAVVAGRPRLDYLGRNMLELLPKLEPKTFDGIDLVLNLRGGEGDAAENVLRMLRNYREQSNDVFAGLLALAPRSQGLRGVIGYLASDSGNLNVAALAQLKAARNLLATHPNATFQFEAVALRRVVDLRVFEEGRIILDVEIKEVSHLFYATTEHAQTEFMRDVVRAIQERPGQPVSLARIRWLVREAEVIGRDVPTEKILEQRVLVLGEIRRQLGAVFERPIPGITLEQQVAAKRYFEKHFTDIVRLF